ncbi:aldo-keto reductase 1B-like [Onthophagus taurus]|uniref:aldo-keto reductase 1B-like n=1 Tax=Onthophagus taurus TaxID=166361 RepID=UPI000C20ABED|nr:1,5-anhydro-D-fructose reductase-like [Onthophagus taurus]
MANVPTITFNNGNKFPMFGLGTWKSEPGKVTQAVKDAIDAGYRHLDCAHVYENEPEVGAGIAAKISEGVVKREDLFITSKLWNTYHNPEAVEPALKVTLKNLGLDYLDLYLIHWPFAFKDGDVLFPLNANKKIEFADHDFVPTWKAMEALYKKGLVKNIGISNFNKDQIERLLESAEVVPQTNQVECSPFLNQLPLSDYCRSKNITITAYSPLGSGDKKLLEDSKFESMAKKYGKSVAQILIKYQVQRGHIVIPKSVTKSRIIENYNIWDFEISKEDMGELNNMDINLRTCPFSESKDAKLYPFNAKY